MTSKFDHLFSGYQIVLDIPAIHLTSFQGQAVRDTIKETPAQKLRYTCLIAEATNDSLNGGKSGTSFEEYGDYEVNGEIYRLNPKGRSQFGMDATMKPYLTTSLIHVDSGVRYAFTWRGDNVPYKLQELAVCHDEGQDTEQTRVELSLDAAEKHIVGEKNGRKANDPRRNHDSGPNNKRRLHGDHRRTHRRICRKDL